MAASEAPGQPGQARRIGTAARATALTVRVLHSCEQIGLLVPSGRSSAGHRPRWPLPTRHGPRPPYRSREDPAVMHPLQLGPLASQHIADRHEAAAARRRAAGGVPVRVRIPVRRRAGWALIHLGLRLAASAADT